MGAVGVEIRVRVTAPAKFDSGRRGHPKPDLDWQAVAPTRVARTCDPKSVTPGEGTWLRAL